MSTVDRRQLPLYPTTNDRVEGAGAWPGCGTSYIPRFYPCAAGIKGQPASGQRSGPDFFACERPGPGPPLTSSDTVRTVLSVYANNSPSHYSSCSQVWDRRIIGKARLSQAKPSQLLFGLVAPRVRNCASRSHCVPHKQVFGFRHYFRRGLRDARSPSNSRILDVLWT